MGGRKLRLEFPGACYHVINRGNYRRDIFATNEAKDAFERCLFVACEKSGWLLHAYVVMRNHYHLALETPLGNLVAGMQWLQSTFANRFNRFRRENGHLFQGRYKALLVEEGEAMGLVCDYIHLNPVRAHIHAVGDLANYRHSSFRFLQQPKLRPPWLRLDLVLAAAGLADTAVGRSCYLDHLAWQAAAGPLAKSPGGLGMSQGWAIGSTGFKSCLLQDHAVIASARAWEVSGATEMRERAWENLAGWCLSVLRQRESDLNTGRKSAPWKVAIAVFLKERTQASNPWLARRLKIGRAKYVSRLVTTQPLPSAVLDALALLRGKWAA